MLISTDVPTLREPQDRTCQDETGWNVAAHFMTSKFRLQRALALALVDAPWERGRLIARIIHVVGTNEPWIHEIVDDALFAMASADDAPVEPDDELDPDDDSAPIEPSDKYRRLAAWFGRQPALVKAIQRGVRIVRPWVERPEMRDSRWPVPALPTSGELARWLGISHQRLDVLADQWNLSRDSIDPRARHYRYTWLPKRTGGHRLLEAPKPTLRRIQRYLLDDIVARIPPHAAAHGFRTGHSVRTFARPHVGREVVMRLDLHAFFTSITAPRVASIFRAAGYPYRIAGTLAALCTHAPPRDVITSAPSPQDRRRLEARHLPQGAPTSGALANLVAHHFDVRVAALAAGLGASYTRYADDVAISGPRSLARAAPTLIPRIGAIAIEEGFALNFRKTRVMKSSTRQRLTGLVVNERLAIARADLEELRAILHNCVRFGPQSQNRADVPDFRAHLEGRVSWVTSIDANKGGRLAAQLARIQWPAV